jgi:PAS domain S-box-containing protein
MASQKTNHRVKRLRASGSRKRASVAERDELVYKLELQQTIAAREIEKLENVRRLLEESRNGFLALFEQSPVGLVIVDESGHIHNCNAAMLDIVGFERERLLHLLLTFLVPRQDAPLMLAHLAQFHDAQFRADGPKIISNLRLCPKNREVIPVQLSSVPFGWTGGRRIFLTAVTDFSERSRSEQALAAAKEFAEAIVQTVRQPLIVLDSDLRIVSVNRAFCELFRRPAEYLDGRVLEVVLNLWWSGNVLREELEKVLLRNEPLDDYQVTVTPPEVGRRILLLNARPLPQKGKKAQRLLVALEDITDQEQARAVLNEANEVLEERVATRTEALRRSYEQMESFCYSIAHDLRSPLRSMTGFSKILSEQFGEKIGAEGRVFTDRISHSAERMDGLIRDLLQYGRLNTVELPIQDVDLDLVFGDVLTQLERDIEDRHALIRKPQTLPKVHGNRAVLHVVLLNLLTNAMKFVPPSTVPQIGVRWDRSQSRLWVEDNGIGIAPENHQRIFGVFQRLHAENAYPGTGIGLALVSKGVERMGGHVGVLSEVGKGSRFWVELNPVNGHPPAFESE